MANFSTETKCHAWVGTVNILNMEKAGLKKEEYKNPEYLAQFLSETWTKSGKGRTAGISVCLSEKELYHAHVALYGNTTTLGNVAKIMFDSHIEPQLGGKKELMGYLLKEPPYEEKGEQVLYTMGLENIQEKQGSRSDLEEISYLLESGYTPMQIMEQNFAYRRFEKMIKSAFINANI